MHDHHHPSTAQLLKSQDHKNTLQLIQELTTDICSDRDVSPVATRLLKKLLVLAIRAHDQHRENPFSPEHEIIRRPHPHDQFCEHHLAAIRAAKELCGSGYATDQRYINTIQHARNTIANSFGPAHQEVLAPRFEAALAAL